MVHGENAVKKALGNT